MIYAGGFSAYAVGGCVRDMLLGREPDDFDITTSASPQETTRIFEGLYPVIPTGIEHGTVTVVFENEPIEITTFRTEGRYSDHRHPDSVSFTRTLGEDLSRRDFTINAMAFNEKEGLVDMYGGRDDLENGLIRAVGDPYVRFSEDALRIFRAVRFSAVLGFEIEQRTADAVHALSHELKLVAAERLGKELKKLLLAENPSKAMRDFSDMIFEAIPELKDEKGCGQHSVYHRYDVWEHTLKALENTPPNLAVRAAVLLHDSGKPSAKYTDDRGLDHFKGHVEKSVEISDGMLKRFAFPQDTKKEIHYLILHHEERIPLTKARVKLLLNAGNEDLFRKLMAVHLADNLAKTEAVALERGSCGRQGIELMTEILESGKMYLQADLDIKGNELKNIGAEGKEISTLLDLLYLEVISGKAENEHSILLKRAGELLVVIRSSGFSFIPLREECPSYRKRYADYLC